MLPQVVDERVLLDLREYVLLLAFAEEAAGLQLAGKAGVRHSASHDEIAVDVAHTLPWVDGGEVRRLLGCSEPLRGR